MRPNKLTVVCQVCGTSFTLPRSQAIARKTCGRKCMASQKRELMKGNRLRENIPPTNAFKSGHSTWNKGVKGIHLSPATEFTSGRNGTKPEPIGTVRIRHDKDDSDRAWVKIDHRKWRPRAIVVWESRFGTVPRGCVIHHHDRDTLNDSIDNLYCMTRKAHIEEHRHELKSNTC